MKTANVLASVLFGSLAAAAPFKRDLVTKTDVVVETIVVYTTVWDATAPATTAEATTTPAAGFYEAPKVTTTAAATSAPAPAAPAVEAPKKESTTSVETPAYTPPAVTSVAPVETSAAPAPSSTTTEAAAPTVAATSGGGESYTGSLTENPYGGALGACGEAIQDTDMVVALGAAGFGASTYDTMTGEPTNEWCGKSISITYNGGEPVTATIKDKCPGCSEYGLDATDAVWKALAGDTAYDRFQVSWTVV